MDTLILCENLFNSKKLQGDSGHFRDNNQIILSKVAKIALKIIFKVFTYNSGVNLITACGRVLGYAMRKVDTEFRTVGCCGKQCLLQFALQ